jgi:hypothetical protein
METGFPKVCKELQKEPASALQAARRNAKIAAPSIRRDLLTRHSPIANHVASATAVTTTAHQTTGVTCFELPLRGESLAA